MKPANTIVKCPVCEASLAVDSSLDGQRAKCPKCGERIIISVSNSSTNVLFGSALSESPHVAAKETSLQSAGRQSTVNSNSTISTPTGTSQTRSNEASIGKLGRFQLREVLGQGAFGRVYRAYDPQLDRMLALKVPIFHEDEHKKAARFEQEAKSAANLRHPNIVPVFDSGKVDGQYYIAAQFIEGNPLSHELKRGAVSFTQAANWAKQIASALAYAHQMGIVHRDVKPQNIMLDSRNEPQLMDFGLAKRVNEDSTMTTEGSLLGTPAYMSPEQARGDTANVGPKSDQYAVGAVLYEMLTGQRAFEGPPHAVLAQIISQDTPSPQAVRADIPRDLTAITLKAMSKTPEARYASCSELAQDLDRWLLGESTLARTPGLLEKTIRVAKRNRQLAAFCVGLFSVITLSLLVVIWALINAELAKSEAVKNLVEANRQTITAQLERDRAAEAEKAAVDAQNVAEQQKADALKANEEAIRAKNEAVSAKNEAVAAKDEAERAKDQVLKSRNEIAKASYQPFVESSLKAFRTGSRALASAHLAKADSTLRNWEWFYINGLLQSQGLTLEQTRHRQSIGPLIQFLPDNKSLLVASNLGPGLEIFDIQTGKVTKQISVRQTPSSESGMSVFSFEIDSTGRWCVTVPQMRHELVLVDLHLGEVVDRIRVDDSPAMNYSILAMSADFRNGMVYANRNSYYFTISNSNKLSKNDAPSEAIREQLKVAPRFGRNYSDLVKKFPFIASDGTLNITCAVVNEKRKEVAVGYDDNGIVVWDSLSGHRLDEIRQHDSTVTEIVYSADGKHLACGGNAGVIIHTTDWAQRRSLNQLKKGEKVVAVRSSAELIDSGYQCSLLTSESKLFLVPLEKSLPEKLIFQQAFDIVGLSEDGLMFTAVRDNMISTYLTQRPNEPLASFQLDLDNYKRSESLQLPNDPLASVWLDIEKRKKIASILLDARNRRILVALSSGKIVCLEIGGKLLWQLDIGAVGDNVSTIISRSGRHAAIGNDLGSPAIVDMVTGEHLRGLTDRVICFMPQTASWLSAFPLRRRGGYVCSLDFRKSHDFVGHQAIITHATFGSDETRLFSAGEDGTIFVWDVKTGQELIRLTEKKTPVGGMCFVDKDNALLVVRESGEIEYFVADLTKSLPTP